MDPSHVTNSTPEVPDSQGTSDFDWRKGPRPEEIVRLLNLRQAERQFGLNDYQVYLAVRRRELRPVQVGGKGRIWYLEDELRGLANRLARPHLHYVAGAA